MFIELELENSGKIIVKVEDIKSATYAPGKPCLVCLSNKYENEYLKTVTTYGEIKIMLRYESPTDHQLKISKSKSKKLFFVTEDVEYKGFTLRSFYKHGSTEMIEEVHILQGGDQYFLDLIKVHINSGNAKDHIDLVLRSNIQED